MEIRIRYCKPCNYRPKAIDLAVKLGQRYGVKSKLVASSGGVFEISVDGELIYSKAETGEFPNFTRLFETIDALVQSGSTSSS